MHIIYHITTWPNWELALAKQEYTCPSIALEGFIHCSTEAQVPGVLDRYYAGQTNLCKLSIDVSLVKPILKYERSPSIGEEFPHIFGALNLDAVVAVEKIN